MALVDIKTGKSRTKFVEFVVVGDEGKGCKLGDIRWVHWDRHKTSPMIDVQYYDAKTRSRVQRIQVAAEFEKRGWRLLRDMYAEDSERSKHWEDFKAFTDRQMEDPASMVGKEFPEKYLPKKVQELRKQAEKSKAERTEFVFPSEAKAAEAAKAAAEKPAGEKPSARKRSASA